MANPKSSSKYSFSKIPFWLLVVLFVLIVLCGFVVYVMVNETEDSDNDDNGKTSEEISELPIPSEGFKTFEFVFGRANYMIIAPEETIFQQEDFEGFQFFTGQVGLFDISGQLLQDPLLPNEDCSNYTEQYLTKITDPGVGFKKYINESGIEACSWIGEDNQIKIWDFVIFDRNEGYGMRISTDATGELDFSGDLDGYLLIGSMDRQEANAELLFTDGFESGDTSAWSAP